MWSFLLSINNEHVEVSNCQHDYTRKRQSFKTKYPTSILVNGYPLLSLLNSWTSGKGKRELYKVFFSLVYEDTVEGRRMGLDFLVYVV